MNEPGKGPQPGLSARLFSLLRSLQLAVIVMCLFMAGLAEILHRHERSPNLRQMLMIISLLAVLEAAAIVYVRRVKISQAEGMLRADSEDRIGLIEARKWYAVAFAFCAGIAMYGFTLRIMGAAAVEAAIFYVASIGLALFCTPRKPE